MKFGESLIGIFLIIVCGIGLFSFVKNVKTGNEAEQSEQPLQVVQMYYELVKTGDDGKIKEIATYYPGEYWTAKDKEAELTRDYLGEPKKQKPIDESDKNNENNKKDIEVLIHPDSSRLSPADNVTKFTPEEIRRDGAFLSYVRNVWTNDAEARVRVEMRSTKSEKYLAVRDFLLYKKNGEWKIFQVDTPSLFNVYGVPKEQGFVPDR